MKSFVAISAFAAVALAQLSVVENALSAIQSETSTLDSDINAYNGGDVSGLVADASAVLSAINAGNTAVGAISPLASADAFSLIDPVNALATVVSTAVDDAVAKKATFDAGGNGYTILTTLQSFLSAANTFASTVTSKVPAGLAPTAQQLAGQIASALSSGISVFTAETPGGGSSSTSSGSVSSTVTSTGTTTSTGAGTTSTGLVTSTSTSVGTTTPTVPANTTTPLVPFNGASVPTAAAAYGAIVLAAFGAVAAM